MPERVSAEDYVGDAADRTGFSGFEAIDDITMVSVPDLMSAYQNGSLDLEDEMLERLDLVVVSVHSRFELPAGDQTERIVRAIQHPSVDVLAHPTGRLLGRRKPFEFDLDEVLHACREHRVAVELNAHPERLDLRDTHLMRARELGVPVVISTDAHRTGHLDLMRYGVEQARRAWLEPRHVLNTRPLEELLETLGKDGGSAPG